MILEHPTSPNLWRAVWNLAELWSRTPLVKGFADTLPRNQRLENRGDQAIGMHALLQHLEAGAGMMMMMQPLMLGSRVPVLLDQPMIHSGAPVVDQGEIAEWLTMASQIEAAHRMTLAWLRSRLAGYPLLRAPQLAPGTPLTTFEMTTEYIWTKEELAGGLHLTAAPPGHADLLGASANAAKELDEAARYLVRSLEGAPAWIRFHDSLTRLDEVGKAALRDARRDLTKRLAAESIDDYEKDLAWPRAEYRSYTVAEVVGSLTGSAREYADAFTDVHELLTLVACDVFGELALFGEPWPTPVLNLEMPEPGHPMVAFEGPDSAGLFLAPGQVLWLANESVTDAVRIEAKSIAFDVEGVRSRFKARVLIGSGEGWQATKVQPQDSARE